MDKQFYKIKNQIDSINSISNWSEKYKEILTIKNQIKKRKDFLLKEKELLESKIEPSEYDFDEFDLDKVIGQINKTNSISKQVKSLMVLKEWFANEKAKVIIRKNDN